MAQGDVEVNINTNNSLKCIKLNGIDENFSVVTSPFYTASATSFSTNIKMIFSSEYINGSVGSVFDSASGNPNVNQGIFLLLDDRGAGNPTNGIFLDFDTVTGGIQAVVKSNVFTSEKKKYTIGCTYDNVTSTAKIYVDGVDVGATTSGGGTGNFVPRNFTMKFGSLAGDTTWLKGYVGDIRFHKRALSAAEMLQSHQGKLITNGLIARWNFQDDTFNDSVGSSDGTNNGTQIVIEDVAISKAVFDDRSTANDKYLAVGLPGGQVLTTVVEET
jgi:hypothetical protein